MSCPRCRGNHGSGPCPLRGTAIARVHPNAAETMNRVARSLGGAAHVAYLSRDVIAQERDLAELAVEVSQLLDVLAGVFVTNPEERVHAHMHSIDRMIAALAPIDPGERHGP